MSERRREMLKQSICVLWDAGAQIGEPREILQQAVRNAVLENPAIATDMEAAVQEVFQDKIWEANQRYRTEVYRRRSSDSFTQLEQDIRGEIQKALLDVKLREAQEAFAAAAGIQ